MSPSVAPRSPSGGHSSRRPVSPRRDHGEPGRRGRSPDVSSPLNKSPSRRERSQARHKSSHRDRGGSPTRDRHSSRVRSPKREKSSSPVSRSPSPRTKRLRRAQASEGERERNYGKGKDKSPKQEKSSSPMSRSPSPRTKRLRRAQASEREHERNYGKGRDKSKHERSHKERDFEKEAPRNRRERTERERDSEKGRVRDGTDGGSSRSRHRQSESPSDHHRHHRRHHSRSPPPASRSRARDEDEESRGAEQRDDASDALAKMEAAEQALTTKEKAKPSFELSGKLAEETNRVRGVTLLFTEPPDARKPTVRWRLYVFKGGEVLDEPLYVHRQSCYLFGRERRVADIPTDHPSCSKQHAVLQFRQVEKEQPDGMMSKQVRPYMMDLGSTNKTFVNDIAIEPQRYYELFEKDTIKFGNSSREYVLLHENSNN
ncbi:FHA domain-containing protein DDL [Beta vulgaris subsp. vulgaris]|uniref:FHA domain-containing protein DDL n=1 Tax=Beta vulgaris subsp. vulgaris TaxID=3555 RepID=UPI00053F8834|nr:FHA domain-containing protein DDL [Beta vulgaris subsp. vulgaris]